ncbi:MAG: T9SS C-terminal target domain-containing protein [Bacteroidota bacterium]
MEKNCIKLIVSTAFFALSLNMIARENIGSPAGMNTPNPNQNRSVNSQCVNATAQIDLDINNVRAKILNGGDMWWDIFGSTNARYQIPKPSSSSTIGPSSQFASSVWVGGYDAGGQLKVAAQTYRQTGNDYWPGPLRPDATTDATRCLAWDKFWKINKADVQAHYNWVANGMQGADPITVTPTLPDAVDQLTNWPAFGPEGQPLAPFYDYNGDGAYDFSAGDVPDFDVTGNKGCSAQLFGDQNIFWVFNDKGNIHTETGGEAIGLEIQAQAFAFQTHDELNNATFLKYKIINKSSFRLDSTFFGLWDDADLGYAFDDFVGCDVGLGLGILYNGTAVDGSGQTTSYGANPPAVGVDFFEGPFKDPNGLDDSASTVPASFLYYGDGIIDNERLGMCKFLYFNNDWTPNGNPQATDDYYQYLTSTWKDAQHVTYGGNGRTGGSVYCDYMFPGTSDPTGFGTNHVIQAPWDETTSHNTPADRRFVESSGPFKLQPGAVNYITIGVPWARATQGGNLASVALLKGADIKAQELFNNCFSTLNGPTSPNLYIQELDKELILTWSNPKGSNNNPRDTSVHPPLSPVFHNETYSEDYNKSSGADSAYRFQGYIVYQLRDGSVGATDLYNVDKARIVFQCDKKDGIKQIVNYTSDVTLSALVPQEMVNGADNGIVHSVSIKEDKFATGDNHLINHKSYFYAIVAYGYSPTQNPVNLNTLTDYKPFIAGNYYSDPTFYHTGIPHNPSPEAGGTVAQSTYGEGPKITRLEGQGNGGRILELTSSTIDEIMSASNGYRTLHPIYENSYGPVKVQVIDPLNVPENNEFRLYIETDALSSNLVVDTNSRWTLKNISTGESVASETTIRLPNEQIINGQKTGSVDVIPRWGISVSVVIAYDPSNSKAADNGFLEATMTFADPTKQWLSGIPDGEAEDQTNWIRSGTYVDKADGSYSDYLGLDDGQVYEKLLGGTWAPYRLCATTNPATTAKYRGGPAWNSTIAMSLNKLKNLASVDVVITSDKSKWTRCPVLEMGEESTLSVGGAKKMTLRDTLSVDKNGLNSRQLGYNPAEGDLNGTKGMGWFPGYAINLETGERLNMAFGEDSWLVNDNGSDMKWNPTSSDLNYNFAAGVITPIFGGKHYIYIFGHNADQTFASNDPHFPNQPKNVPRYDGGKFIHDVLGFADVTNLQNVYARQVYEDAMWVNIPLLARGHSLLETDVKIRLRVSKSYQRGFSTTGYSSYSPIDTSANPLNHDLPLYGFNTNDIGTKTANADAAVKALDLISIVPNPYYAYSGYEMKTGDNIVKITNLPENCTVTIYTLNGALVRTFKVDQPATAKNTMGIAVTSVDWDLKNQMRIPIASGLYLIHIDVPNVGEKTLKWFGVMRPVDLDAY